MKDINKLVSDIVNNDDININEKNELLCEIADKYIIENTLTKNLEINFAVSGNGRHDRGFINTPYFKVFEGDNPDHATKITRISIFEPKYIIHENKKWNLTSKQIKYIIGELQSVYKDDMTLCDVIIDECLKYSKMYAKAGDPKTKKALEKIENCRDNMPDYTQLGK